MTDTSHPLVSVVTPFYNTAEYLEECIQSVLRQTLTDWEYILVDNCSTDGSREIAEKYASQDSRIRVVSFTEFVGQVPNYNRALRLISPHSSYVKIVQADDWIYPDCLRLMVRVAQENPKIGIVSSYAAIGSNIGLTGLQPPREVFSGDEICRRFFLQGTYLFGSPTCVMMRSDLVRARENFYRLDSPFEDAEVCFDLLRENDFGFVHQVLTYTRRDNVSIMTRLSTYHSGLVTRVLMTRRYGPHFLTPEEYKVCWRAISRSYYRVLGEDVLRMRSRDFWEFQREAMATEEIPLSRRSIAVGAVLAGLELALNPWQTVERTVDHFARARRLVWT